MISLVCFIEQFRTDWSIPCTVKFVTLTNDVTELSSPEDGC